jgi:hypothetical protein
MSIKLGTAIAYLTLDAKGFHQGLTEAQQSLETLKVILPIQVVKYKLWVKYLPLLVPH